VVVDGDNTTINNSGTSSISGKGSTGSIINGNKTHITNDGDLNVSDGGTGAKITGDGAIVENNGNSTIDGADSTGLYIDGNNALVINDGAQVISGGATGTRIDGDNARIANTGDISVDGTDSTAVIINGDNASLAQVGDLLVTGGATGIVTDGSGNKITNTGNITVRDKDSVGFIAAGEQSTFSNKGDINVSLNGTGAQISGDTASVNLVGDITVTAVQDSDGVYRGGLGLTTTGNNNAVNIAGNVVVSGAYAADSKMADSDILAGLAVNGNQNQVDLTGSLSINVSDESAIDGQYLDTVGLYVQGDGNAVNLMGGISITYAESDKNGAEARQSSVAGIYIDGNSTVTLSGDSTLDVTTIPGSSASLAYVTNGGHLILDKNSTVNVTETILGGGHFWDRALLMVNGSGSSIENQGDITGDGAIGVLLASDGAQAKNSGNITTYATTNGDSSSEAITAAQGQNTVVSNEAGGAITVISTTKPVASGGISKFPLKWYGGVTYGMLAYDYGEVSNDAGATLSLHGAGVYGVAASKGTALNAGDIYLDGFIPTLDDGGNITGETPWMPGNPLLASAGMVAGSTDGGNGDATATNTGNITVNNAGYGMMALNGGTAINQGVITLTADDGVSQSGDNQLVGMVALDGGTVINDASGTININADYGKPFYADSNSLVVNYGTICIGGECQNSDEYNPTDSNVSLRYTDGLISAAGEDIVLSNNVAVSGDVGNDGKVTTGKVVIDQNGQLTNSASGEIVSNVSLDKGKLTNDGKISAVDAEDNSTVKNNGDITTLTVGGGGTAYNSATGSVDNVKMWKGSLDNQGYIGTLALENTTGAVNNDGVINEVDFYAATTFNNNGTVNRLATSSGATVNNLSGGVVSVPVAMQKGALNNWGEVDGTMDIASNAFTFYNDGTFNGNIKTASAKGGTVVNDGVINTTGSNTVAMSASGSAEMVNNGTINLGTEGTTDTGLVGMQLESNATSSAVVENNGAINIYASNSYAFSQLGSNGHIVNNGTIYIDDSVTGSGLIKQSGKNIEGNGEGGDGTEVHYVDFTAPIEPTADSSATAAVDNGGSSAVTNDLSGYVVGTNADGSAGQLTVSNASMNGVEINTGFTSGTAATSVTFDNVVQGSNLTDASAITSTSVVWTAQGSNNASGNVDVTMTKNAYADVATDSSVNGVAQALDAGYTNNELYNSLNVGTTAQLNDALKQVSGSQATTVFREARVLSNRFNMLADAAPQMGNGLAFNVVAQGDPRAELGNKAQYDMLALRQKLNLTESQNLTLEYGMARIDGSGAQAAGDNGVTGGYSQFFGLKHSMALNDSGLSWNNALRYDVHNLDSSRSVSYGDTSKVADSNARQQYMEFRSEGAKTFTLNEGLTMTPYAGVKFRHTAEDGYKERSAGDFNLTMNSGSETAVDSILGLKLDYAGKNGWSANMTLEGGPNLSYAKSQRTASLQGAAGQQFNVDDGQKGGGVNSLATVGLKFSAQDTALHLDAYQWKEDDISDKGFMLSMKKSF